MTIPESWIDRHFAWKPKKCYICGRHFCFEFFQSYEHYTVWGTVTDVKCRRCIKRQKEKIKDDN